MCWIRVPRIIFVVCTICKSLLVVIRTIEYAQGSQYSCSIRANYSITAFILLRTSCNTRRHSSSHSQTRQSSGFGSFKHDTRDPTIEHFYPIMNTPLARARGTLCSDFRIVSLRRLQRRCHPACTSKPLRHYQHGRTPRSLRLAREVLLPMEYNCQLYRMYSVL